jgi:hypothetical protein
MCVGQGYRYDDGICAGFVELWIINDSLSLSESAYGFSDFLSAIIMISAPPKDMDILVIHFLGEFCETCPSPLSDTGLKVLAWLDRFHSEHQQHIGASTSNQIKQA